MPGLIQSIERAAAVIRLLAAGSGWLRASEIGASLGLAKATTHGILRTLRHVGFVQQDPATGRYQLAAAVLAPGTRPLDRNELRSRVINWADPLAARSGEAVRVGALLDGQVLVVHHVFRPDDTPQQLETGALLPAHATALGKVLLAHDALSARDAGAGPLTAYTRRTVTKGAALRRTLAEVRTQGWAAEVEESVAGQAGVAAPIRTYGGLVVGAIGVSGPTDRICDSAGRPRAALVALVREIARAVSRDLAKVGS
ncbi:IclR family transcriptional regulator [Amorphoplanes nipponensis]|uniref:Glycerol operon regulatory protein n=1 Tax=Actinoplanes nipponensis TaxID=135950 RepID=A0A919MIH7_9ACTN|nr:IclR family transcriptional regulator [Actinoplanes nipponensis]GIE50764.1 IclR family transcriptional regulator [Actinoplanes nipponensis]